MQRSVVPLSAYLSQVYDRQKANWTDVMEGLPNVQLPERRQTSFDCLYQIED